MMSNTKEGWRDGLKLSIDLSDYKLLMDKWLQGNGRPEPTKVP